VVTPIPSGPMDALARSAKSAPVGTRCKCTVVSVFMNMNSSGSSAAPTPLAESTTMARRCMSVTDSSSTRGTNGLSHATGVSPSAVACLRQLTVSR
jgi:hypothetical protein